MGSQCKLEWIKHNMITFLLTGSGRELQLWSRVKPEPCPDGLLAKTFTVPLSSPSKKAMPKKCPWLIPLGKRIPDFQLCSASHSPLSLQKPGSFFVTPLASYWHWHRLVTELPSHCFAELIFSSPDARHRMCSGHIIKTIRSTVSRGSLHRSMHMCVSPYMQEHVEVLMLPVWNPNS